MAELSGDPGMLEAFERGQDVHSATASRVYGVGLTDVSDEMRRQAKMINFGLMYGMSVFGLSPRLGIPRKEAQDIVESTFLLHLATTRILPIRASHTHPSGSAAGSAPLPSSVGEAAGSPGGVVTCQPFRQPLRQQ